MSSFDIRRMKYLRGYLVEILKDAVALAYFYDLNLLTKQHCKQNSITCLPLLIIKSLCTDLQNCLCLDVLQ